MNRQRKDWYVGSFQIIRRSHKAKQYGILAWGHESYTSWTIDAWIGQTLWTFRKNRVQRRENSTTLCFSARRRYEVLYIGDMMKHELDCTAEFICQCDECLSYGCMCEVVEDYWKRKEGSWRSIKQI